MRILLLLSDLGDNGAHRVALERALAWQRAGDEVALLSLVHPGPGDLAVPRELRLLFATDDPRPLRVALPAGLARARRWAARADVVVSATEIGLGLLVATAAARAARRPVSVLVQSDPAHALASYVPPWAQPPTRAALATATQAVCVGVDLAARVAPLRHDRETVAVPNAVPGPEVAAAARRGPRRDPGAPPLVVGCGRLTRQKGFDLLLEAVAAARGLGAPAVEVVVLGEGDDRTALEAQAERLLGPGVVAFPGHVADPHAVVGTADVFVLPSRWEGYALALVEALAAGTPCVALDCPTGPREVLADGAFGALVPAEDVPALARALADHLADPAPLRAAAARAVVEAPRMFDPAAAAAEHRAALARLVDGRR
ncbi:glycosyltransferase [Klenkia brasiliensis]|uniref:Glycosyltransferase involved in cell wall bisynthesis n=1 Tax=Klenkia brasiliensis TaxID=333142 RepID=A0A1G7MUG8_9ACTN|nr:glycosyltransferase [Klenkia brasiliensis]SDF65394.1 Glycosyltransferase involved in cell wall bisynthesis [Klenkia brasiliensis]